MDSGQQIRIGLVGFGEIGSTLGRGLRAAGLESVVAYDKHAFEGAFSALIQRRAAEAGVQLLRSPQELAERADGIIGATPGSSSVASADALAAHLGPRHRVVDIASATPQVKQQVAERLSGTGAAFVDGSIAGTPRDGVGMPILVAGQDAARVRDALLPWGMRMEVVSERIGDASAIKILRSVVMKGLEALLLECMLGARRYGLGGAALPGEEPGEALLADRERHADDQRDPCGAARGRGGDVGRDAGECRPGCRRDPRRRRTPALGRGSRHEGAFRRRRARGLRGRAGGDRGEARRGRGIEHDALRHGANDRPRKTKRGSPSNDQDSG